MGKICKIEDFLILLRCFIVTGGKFNTSVVDTDGNLLQVTLTKVANYGDTLTLVAKKMLPTGFVITGGQFATSVIGTIGAPCIANICTKF